MSFQNIGVVLDTGSQYTKAGFAGEPSPRCVIPTAVGRFRRAGLIDGIPLVYCGDEAIRMQGISNLTFPVKEGLIADWDEMEKFWHYIFYKGLHVPPEEAHIMHSVHSLVPRKDKERMAEILFEAFAIQGLYLAKAPVLALNASGRTSGVVWESGYSSSNITPVFEGFPLKHATITSPLTGQKLTDRLQKLMAETGYSFTTPIERKLLDRIKAEMCYVALDYAADLEKFSSTGENKTRFDLPDGQHVLLSEERFKCPEVLFKPSLEGLDCPSIPEIICSSIDKCDIDYRTMFYENIVVSGGTSMFSGLIERLCIEMRKRVAKQPDVKTSIDAMSLRQNCVWTGGSIMASMDNLKGFWLSKEEYGDAGPESVNYKFF
ncbi:uncharacterized protein LOC135086789 [Ostrinia nubilalis]|uniref:uncharacterized protein LOC135086789 n=1 Tax=Ostrinia nubilalis TaxID=29057 RepID=UPI0030824413